MTTAKKKTSKPKTKKPSVAVLIPCYNEEDVIELCHSRLSSAIKSLEKKFIFKVVYVNDGSKDLTLSKLRDLQKNDKRIAIINLSRNFGKEAGMTAGLDYIADKGFDAAVILDADLQDPPELIKDMIDIWQTQNADVVYGQRVSRLGETWFKKFTASWFYKVINKISRVDIPVNTGDFRLMNSRALKALMSLREQHRFMKGLFAWIGYNQIPMKYHREPRAAGRTKWDYFNLWNLSLEGITGFSMTPLRLATLFGFLISAFAFAFGIYILLSTLLSGTNDVPGYPSLMVMVTFLSGIQLMTIGILGEYIGRIFGETKQRPLYLIDKTYEA